MRVATRVARYGLYLSIVVLLLLELGLRAFFALQLGPRVLLYGTPGHRNQWGDLRSERMVVEFERERHAWNRAEQQMDSVSRHRRVLGGYDKYFPNEKKHFRDIDPGMQ